MADLYLHDVVPVKLTLEKDGGTYTFEAYFDRTRRLFYLSAMTEELITAYGYKYEEIKEQLTFL